MLSEVYTLFLDAILSENLPSTNCLCSLPSLRRKQAARAAIATIQTEQPMTQLSKMKLNSGCFSKEMGLIWIIKNLGSKNNPKLAITSCEFYHRNKLVIITKETTINVILSSLF